MSQNGFQKILGYLLSRHQLSKGLYAHSKRLMDLEEIKQWANEQGA